MKHYIVLVLFVCGVNNINCQILSGSNNLSLDPSNIKIDATITTKKTKDGQKSMTKEDSPITMKQVGDGYHCTVHLEKSGKLKSLIKDGSQITRLNVTGEVNKNDVKFIKSLPRLKTLDASKATEKEIIDEYELKTVTQLDTLYIPTSSKFSDCHIINRLFWKISAKYYVANNVLYIREFKSANSYPGIGGFPLNDDKTLNITGTLDLTDAVHVSTYFNKTNIQRVIFSSKLKKIDPYAFFYCDKLVDAVFGESQDLRIKWPTFPRNIKRIIIPKGLKYEEYSDNLREYSDYGAVILNKIPDLALTLEVKKPGDLGKMLMSNQVPQIVKLKLIGTLNFTDMENIEDMISLEELDLSEAVINETSADKVRKAEQNIALFELANEAQYQKDGNRGAYKLRSKMADKVEKVIEEEKSEPGSTICQLPDNAFVKLPFLKKLYLPATLKEVKSTKLTESTFLEEIWCSMKTTGHLRLQSSGITIKYYN